jgi:tetratricopeptide (TPR) repeat protein
VPAEGKDLYRNLVFSIPLTKSRFVRGVELDPGNARVLHHAFINIDETRHSRRLAERQSPPAFDGMDIPPPANMPAGQFLAWQPGRVPGFAPPGLSWLLRTNTDIVLQLHLHPSGRPETIRPAVAFYFTDEAPTNTAFRIGLKALQLDIPAGDSNYVVEESFRLPVDVQVLRVETHAHYLAKEMQAWASLPDGKKQWLIWIKDWDFNWQGGYDFASPVDLPGGSVVFLHYIYDNSTNNPHNPNQPPKRVRFGLQTTDEMGELWLQAVVPNPKERQILAQDYFTYLQKDTFNHDLFELQFDPGNVEAHLRLGHNLLARGQIPEAVKHFAEALKTDPQNGHAHHEMALACLAANRWEEAENELEAATRFDPYDSEGFGNLGYIYARSGRVEQARSAFQQALKLNPDDTTAAGLLRELSERGPTQSSQPK